MLEDSGVCEGTTAVVSTLQIDYVYSCKWPKNLAEFWLADRRGSARLVASA